MKKEILIYEKDRDVLQFLRSFFREKKEYSTHFVRKDRNSLRKKIAATKPDAVIVSSPEGLRHLNPSEVKCPIIAMISTNETRGIHSAVKSDVECYLLRPFHKEELDHKLRAFLNREGVIDTLFKENEDFSILLELATLASSTLNPKEVLYLIVKKISETIKVTRCSIISINAKNQRYADVVSSFEDPGISRVRIDLHKYPEVRKSLSIKKPVVIKDAQKDPLMKEVRDIITLIGIRSIVVIPVIFRDEVIGTLLLRTSRAGHAFTKREIRLCIALANASANALYNAFLYERLDREKKRLEKLAITDYLTGIYNIRYFYYRLEEEFSRAERYKIPLSCIMLDIDHFKRINDTYGHRIGDIVLREFAQLVKRHTRRSDLFARYGGEEFILLLPQTSMRGARTEGERLRQIIKKHHFKPIRKDSGVKVSLGIACTPDGKIKNYDDLIHVADNALFKAKEEGRDRIAYSPSVGS
jgi:two-component system cell cycle response regulator